MKTGIELIEKERREQIDKHGFTFEKYDRYYTKGELVQAAKYCLERVGKRLGYANIDHPWPKDWSKHFADKIAFKSDVGKLTVAGAFYMAENHRLKKSKYEDEIKRIAAEIDRLQSEPEAPNT